MQELDWDEWERRARVPTTYDPPQLRPGFRRCCACVDWYGMRSPVCLPCDAVARRLACTRDVSLRDLDTLRQLARAAPDSKCPSSYKGLWWLRDHVQATSLMTVHDALWSDDGRQASNKSLTRNWVKANTCYGAASTWAMCTPESVCGVHMTIHVSPNRQWMLFSIVQLNQHFWAYVFPRATTLTTVDGSRIHVARGDMLRLEFVDWRDPTSRVTYAYLVQRVVADDGSTTSAYREFVRRQSDEYAHACVDSSKPIDTRLLAQQHCLRMTRY